MGSAESSVSGRGSSLESGELLGSGERSKASSDMDVCSDSSLGEVKGRGRGLVGASGGY